MTTFDKVQDAVNFIVMNPHAASQYISAHNSSGDLVRIRVSHHGANPDRMGDKDISIVVVLPEQKEDDYDGMDSEVSAIHVAKKKFKSFANQHYLDENGTNGDVDDILAWHDIV